jgi:hexosaminidase
MKHAVSPLVWVVLVACSVTGCRPDASPEAKAAFEQVIPRPAEVIPAKGRFVLTEKTQIVVSPDVPEARAVAQHLAGVLNPATGFKLEVEEAPVQGAPVILFSLLPETNLGEEGYVLRITSDSIQLIAGRPAGLFYAVQTLRQLLPPAIELTTPQERPWEIAAGTIRDAPRYAWRASMLDVARHFFGVSDVKRYIDLLALYKFNKLHLHLSDDQGWRIEIKSWPRLATHGGSTQVGGGPGGFYTQQQYTELVAYARARHITIVPEIDMPSHTNAILASYGELNGGITQVPRQGRIELPGGRASGRGRPTQLYTGIEVGFSTLQSDMPATFRFAQDVLTELAALTPGPYIHIGGDEAAVTPHADYILMTNRFIDMIRRLGKTSVGWEETAQADIGADHLVQYWNRAEFAHLAVKKGARLIMSPARRVYLDMKYDSTTRIGLNWAAYIELDDAYNWEPATLEPGITDEHIVGIEAPLWTETVENRADFEYLLFPRITAVAEVAWTPAALRNLAGFKERVARHELRWQHKGINFYASPQVPRKN